MDQKLDDYYRRFPGPLGSTDRRCAVDPRSLFATLNEGKSELSALWTEKSTTSWAQSLGATGTRFTPNVEVLDNPFLLILYSSDY